jgi:hypothetical protein
MVALTEYVPASDVVAVDIVGFCEVEVYPPGPFQVYVAPATVEAVNDRSFPVQIGALLPATGVAGGGATVTAVVPAGPVQPFSVAVTE